MLVQCSAVQCLLSTQCSAVLEVAARARLWLRLGWAEPRPAESCSLWQRSEEATIPAHPPRSQLSLSLATTTLLLRHNNSGSDRLCSRYLRKQPSLWSISTQQRRELREAQFLYRDRSFVCFILSYFNLLSGPEERAYLYWVSRSCVVVCFDTMQDALTYLSARSFLKISYITETETEEFGLLRPLLPRYLLCFTTLLLHWAATMERCVAWKGEIGRTVSFGSVVTSAVLLSLQSQVHPTPMIKSIINMQLPK